VAGANDDGGPVSPLRSALADYLAIRRSLGFTLARAEKLLNQFISCCEDKGAETITIAVALAWATLPNNSHPAWAAQRLSVVRGFARHVAFVDDRTEVPPLDLLPDPSHRRTPHLFTTDEVAALMRAAEGLRTPLRRWTLSTLIGLLYATGMRVGEALDLDRDDVDFANSRLVVRHAKFDKSRELVLHHTTVQALRTYATQRDLLCPHPSSPSYFVSQAGSRLKYGNVHWTWLRLVKRAGLESCGGSPARPHDLRHSFAVSTLAGWYRDGADVEARLPELSTYLGHVHPGSTYWYLSAAPELLGWAATRLAATTEGQP
jgi:integrase